MIVVDEQGREYEATYPKRAKGLVKSGRARFIGENKICLACPPIDKLEEHTMENTVSENKYTIEFILSQMIKLQEQTEYLNDAFAKLADIPVGQGPGDVAGQAKAQALGDIVRCRETTNQKLLDLYIKMYDDLKPVQDKPTDNIQIKVLEMVERIAINSDPENLETLLERVESLCDSLRFI